MTTTRRARGALLLASALFIARCGGATGDSLTAPTPLTVPAGTFGGIVRDVDSGRGLAEIRVEATGGAGVGHVTLTNSAGQFAFNVPPGTSRFRWSKNGYGTHEAEYTIGAGSKTEVQIVLQSTPR